MNVQGRVYTIVFAVISSALFVFLLALVNTALAERTARNVELYRYKAILKAMDLTFANDDEAYRLFQSEVKKAAAESPPPGAEFYTALRDGAPVLAVVSQGSGLWGTVRFVVAVNADKTRITGVEIISHNETPGLGGRIDEPWYKAQFQGEALKSDGRLGLGAAGDGDADHANGEIDAVTGATITSKMFNAMINDALAALRRIKGGGS